jgi:hypothetical protein
METLVGFIPLILLIVIVVWVYRRSKRKQDASGVKTVSGWLALLTVGLIAFRPLFALSGWSQLNYQEWKHDPMVSLDGWEAYKLSIALLAVLAAGLSIYAGTGLWKGRSWGMVKRAISVLWLTGPAHAMLQAVALYAIFSGRAETKDFATVLIQNVAIAGIWTAYLLRSNQVRELYPSAALPQTISHEEVALDRPTSHQAATSSTTTEKQATGSRLNTVLDTPFKRVTALIAGLGLAMLLIGWLQIVARYWQFWSCLRVMIDHIQFNDTSYVLFTYGFYLSLFGLLGSVFYNRTIGRVASWVRTGKVL